MGATTPVAFDPDPEHLGLVKTFKAGSAILSGQVVGFADAGASDTVIPADSDTTGIGIGVALNSQATTGGEVAVAMVGSVLTVMCAATDTSIDAGHWVTTSSVAGTVLEFDPAIGGHAAALSTGAFPIGYSIADSVAGSGTAGATVKIVIQPVPTFTASS